MKTKLVMLVGVVGLSLVLGACGGDKKKSVNYGSSDRGKGDSVGVQSGGGGGGGGGKHGSGSHSGSGKQYGQGSHSTSAKWVRIARADMPHAEKSHRIDLQGNRGVYSELQFEVSGAAVRVTDVQIVFTDGFRWTTPMNQKFDKKDSSHTLRLPANRRAIDRVYVTYRSLDRGRATLTLSGR